MSGRGTSPSARSLLREHGLRPRRRLGQNFLRDRSYLPTIVGAANVVAGDHVVEIGAGTGVLTGALLETGARVTAIELDDSLHALLKAEMGDNPRLTLVHGNALDFDPEVDVPGLYKLVGNVPYYITGMIVRKFLELAHRPDVLVFTVQLEVAARMTAQPGDMSLLGVSVQYFARPQIVARIPASAFFPRPKVDSAIVKMVPHVPPYPREDAASFFAVARAGFSTRRKMLGNALANGLRIDRTRARSVLAAAHIAETRRAEELSVDEWRQIAVAWSDSAT